MQLGNRLKGGGKLYSDQVRQAVFLYRDLLLGRASFDSRFPFCVGLNCVLGLLFSTAVIAQLYPSLLSFQGGEAEGKVRGALI